MKYYFARWWFLAAVVFVFFSSCTQEPATAPDADMPEIVALFAPAEAYLQDSTGVVIHARIVDPQGVGDIDSVLCFAIRPDGSQGRFAMSDNGTDGDILAGDGQFVARIPGPFWRQPGTGRLHIQATDAAGNEARSDTLLIEVKPGLKGSPPRVTKVRLPEVIFADSSYQFQILAAAEDPEGLEDIEAVLFWVFPPGRPASTYRGSLQDDGQQDDGVAGNGVFGRILNADAFGIERGIYTLIVRARDKAGNYSTAILRYFSVQTLLENLPPRIESVSAPDTISRSQTAPFVITARVSDPNGLADIARVFFNSFLPDGTPASGNPFLMRDDGKKDQNGLGDAVANDGVYSLVISVGPGSPLGTFRFEFQAQDKGNLLSEKVIHRITVVE